MTIELHEMEFHAPIGCLDEEIKNGSDISVDVICIYDFTKAADSDNLGDTLDCSKIYTIVEQEALKRANLLENLASRIANRLKEEDGVEGVKVSVCKKNPPLEGKAKLSKVTIEI